MQLIQKNKTALLFSFLLSFSIVLGHALYTTNNLCESFASISSVFRALFVFLLLIIIIFIFSSYLFTVISQKELRGADNSFVLFFTSKKGFYIVWLLIFLAWTPCFLAYYPGIESYDMLGQLSQVISSDYSTHHPPLHTFIWKICLFVESISSLNHMSVYSIIQMVILSYAVSKMLYFILSKSKSTVFFVCSFLFFAVNPICAIVSLLPIKDNYCACFFILLSISICNLIDNTSLFIHSSKDCIKLVFEALLFCMFRNNAVYALIIAGIAFVCILKSNRRQISFLFLIPILSYFLIVNCIFPMLGVKKGSSVEMMSVPLQQIAFTINQHESEISADVETVSEIHKFLPYELNEISEMYNPRFADPIKGSASLEHGIKPIAIVWIKLLIKYPIDFISSFFSLNLPYWYPFSTPLDQFSGRLFIETCNPLISDTFSFRRNLAPVLLNFYEKIAAYSGVISKFPICILASLSFPIWLILFSMFVSIRKDKRNICMFLIPILFWATYLLGPVSNFRYLIPLYFQYPLFIYFMLKSECKKD